MVLDSKQTINILNNPMLFALGCFFKRCLLIAIMYFRCYPTGFLFG